MSSFDLIEAEVTALLGSLEVPAKKAFDPNQPRDDHGRFGSSFHSGDSLEEQKKFATERLIKDGAREGMSRVRVVKAPNIGLWGDSHFGSQVITGYSAQSMGIPGYRDLDATRESRALGDKFLEVIAEGRGAGENLYHGFNNTKNIEWTPGSTVRLPLTATAGDFDGSANYAIQYGHEDNSGATVFEFPPQTAIAGYSRWDRESTKDFGYTWSEAIVAGEFRVQGTHTRFEQGYKSLPVTVVRLEPVSLFDPKSGSWVKKTDADLSELVGLCENHQVPIHPSSADTDDTEDIDKSFDPNQPRDEHGRWLGAGATSTAGANPYDVGPRTYREEFKPAKPFATKMPQSESMRIAVEHVVGEGERFVESLKANDPAFLEGLERYAWGQGRVTRIDKQIKTLDNRLSKHLAEGQRESAIISERSPEWKVKFDQINKEIDDLQRRQTSALERCKDAREMIRSRLTEWIQGGSITGPTRAPIEIKSFLSPELTEKFTGYIRNFEKVIGGVPDTGRPDVTLRLLPADDPLGGRSYYSYGERAIYINPNAEERTIHHEMGHWLENNDRFITNAALGFIDYRAWGEPLEEMNTLMSRIGYKDTTFKSTEVAREDKFLHPYIGKQYSGATEVTSMGLEMLYTNPGGFFLKDPHHFAFVVGALRVSRRMQ